MTARRAAGAGGRGAALLLAAATMLGACGGSGDAGGEPTAAPGDDQHAEPTPGGRVVYGVEAETPGGFCLPEAQLAVSGIQVARAIYETLTVPDEDGGYAPFLAESVTPNDDFTKWTIELREGVKFHDGSDLTAEVVKNNLDAFRGQYPKRHPMLFTFTTSNWDDVQVTGPLTVEVTAKTPWPAFPAHLYGSGRFGMMGQAQLDDEEHCDSNLIGTGPFMLEEWKVNDHLLTVKNPDYWQEGLPYLDELEFRPILEASQRVNALVSGEIQMTHTMNPLQVDELRTARDAGSVELVESDRFADTVYTMLNAGRPPFDSITARLAVAHAIDRETLNDIRHKGIPKNASGPFAPGNVGYLDDAGFPQFDLDRAKELAGQYEAETGRKIRFTLSSTPEPTNVETGQLMQQMAAEAGIEMELRQIEEATLINQVLAGDYDAVLWRNHAGGDPDLQYVWWKSDSPVNFGRYTDPEIDRLLDAGRVESDPEERRAIYEELNRRFAEQAWNLWGQWSVWTIATAPGLHGVFGPELPGGGAPFPGLADGHPVSGLWIEQ